MSLRTYQVNTSALTPDEKDWLYELLDGAAFFAQQVLDYGLQIAIQVHWDKTEDFVNAFPELVSLSARNQNRLDYCSLASKCKCVEIFS